MLPPLHVQHLFSSVMESFHDADQDIDRHNGNTKDGVTNSLSPCTNDACVIMSYSDDAKSIERMTVMYRLKHVRAIMYVTGAVSNIRKLFENKKHNYRLLKWYKQHKSGQHKETYRVEPHCITRSQIKAFSARHLRYQPTSTKNPSGFMQS